MNRHTGQPIYEVKAKEARQISDQRELLVTAFCDENTSRHDQVARLLEYEFAMTEPSISMRVLHTGAEIRQAHQLMKGRLAEMEPFQPMIVFVEGAVSKG